MLESLLPRLLPDTSSWRFVVFQGKQGLEKRIVRHIRGYKVPNTLFIALRDQDSGDCIKIKQRLVKLYNDAGKEKTFVRIACRELESWYLADLNAVEKGLQLTGIAKKQEHKKYRDL